MGRVTFSGTGEGSALATEGTTFRGARTCPATVQATPPVSSAGLADGSSGPPTTVATDAATTAPPDAAPAVEPAAVRAVSVGPLGRPGTFIGAGDASTPTLASPSAFRLTEAIAAGGRVEVGCALGFSIPRPTAVSPG